MLVGINSHTGALQADVSIARLCVAVKVACSFAMLSFVGARNRSALCAAALSAVLCRCPLSPR